MKNINAYTYTRVSSENAKKVCFSYILFSSEGQKDGSSVERQTPIAPKVANEMGWVYREDLNAQDLGVSAFKGDNIKTLKSIIEAVKSGKIPQGAVMVVEAFDRFSRADLDTAEDVLKEMLRAGLEVFVYRGSHHLTRESLNKPIDRIIALLELAAANEYSAKLSERVKKAHLSRQKKMLNGEVIKSNVCPSWINGKTWELNEHAKTLQTIFNLYLKGIGAGGIAKKLNQGGVKTLSGKEGCWLQGIVYRLLSCRQVIGEQTVNGETIKGYFPMAVPEETFLKVQAKLNDNKGKRPTGTGTTGTIRNIFSGVSFCGCGEPIKVVNGKNGRYMTCYGKIKGTGCCSSMAKYSHLETSFVSLLRLHPEQLVKDENGEGNNVQVQILKGRYVETEKEIQNISEALKIKVTKSLVLVQSDLETKLEDIKRQIELEQAKTVAVKGGKAKLQTILNRIGNLENDNEFRSEVQGWIRETVNRVDVDTDIKTFTVDLKTGNVITMNFDGTVKGCKSFVSLFTGKPVEQQAVAL